jgi:hypothetical protein
MMAQYDPDNKRSDAGPARPPAIVRLLAVIGPISFALCWLAMTIYFVVKIRTSAIEYERRTALIEHRTVKPETLHVTHLTQHRKDNQWSVAIGGSGKDVAWRSANKVDDLRVGTALAAYRFGDDYLIPRFDHGGSRWGEWVFLVIGFLPLAVIAGVVLFKTLRPRPQTSESGPGAPQRPVPIAFTRPFLSFDRMPDDSQLVCLLGTPASYNPLKVVEEAGVLRVRPVPLRLKYAVPGLVTFTALITGVPYFLQRGKIEAFMLAFLGMGWLLVFPTLLAAMIFISRSIEKGGDIFRFDPMQRLLELCRAGRTFKPGEIVAVTLLTRWYLGSDSDGRSWIKTHQTGVLVRGPGREVEHYPVVSQQSTRLPTYQKLSWADRLAAIFQVPVRRIELSLRESRALNDAPPSPRWRIGN